MGHGRISATNQTPLPRRNRDSYLVAGEEVVVEEIERRRLTVQTGIQYALCVRHRKRHNIGTVFCPHARTTFGYIQAAGVGAVLLRTAAVLKIGAPFTASGAI